MDIHITYETLFDLLRKERSLEELQELESQFWKHVVNYMTEREKQSRASTPGEIEKTKIQLKNVKKILKEIYQRRERKILSLALNVIRTETEGFVDTKNMLSEEKALFDETLSMLSRYKHGVLERVFKKELPTILPGDVFANNVNHKGMDYTAGEEEGLDISEITKSKDKEKDIYDDTRESKEEGIVVKFSTTVPKFFGRNKEIFGPYQKDSLVALPSSIASILIKKGKAEQIENFTSS